MTELHRFPEVNWIMNRRSAICCVLLLAVTVGCGDRAARESRMPDENSTGVLWELQTAWNSAVSVYLFADGRAVKHLGVDRSGSTYFVGSWSYSKSALNIDYRLRRSTAPDGDWISTVVDEREQYDGVLGGVLTSRTVGSKDPPRWKCIDRETLRSRNVHPTLLDGTAFR